MDRLHLSIFFLAVATAVCLVNAGLDETRIAELLVSHPRLIWLGTVEDKSYFSETTTRGWSSSRTYCTGIQMELASIETEAQWEFLTTKASYLTTRHWTAARDVLTLQQYVWDGDLANVTIGGLDGSGALIYSALTIYSNGSTLQYSSRSVSNALPVLCEAKQAP